MSNGTCPMGASNAATIAALSKLIETVCSKVADVDLKTNKRIDKVESKQDWMIYLLIVNLVAVIVGYIT